LAIDTWPDRTDAARNAVAGPLLRDIVSTAKSAPVVKQSSSQLEASWSCLMRRIYWAAQCSNLWAGVSLDSWRRIWVMRRISPAAKQSGPWCYMHRPTQ